MNRKILLVGTVSNVAKTIEKELKVVLRALSVFDSVQVFLVESDSTDETVKILEKISLENRNFEFITLEKLKNKYPNRIDRIAYCRNIYVKYIRDNNAEPYFTFPRMKRISKQILEALEYIHHLNLIHCDLKPVSFNILR